ncbi:trypsin-like serine protease [Acetobacter estunensis]|nr:trypsin-like serine protease [Acetobacter estunensis]
MTKWAKGFSFIGLVLTVMLVTETPATAQVMPLRPGIGASDARQSVDMSQLPWSAIGRVQTELGGRCTGFLIAPNVVETAAHCLFIARTGHFIRPHDVHFLRAYDRGHYAAHARAIRFLVPPEYDPRREAATAAFDRATLFLEAPVATRAQTLPVAQNLPVPGSAVVLGGYEQDFSEVVRSDLNCQILGINRTTNGHVLIDHDCDATRGSSGAPLLGRQNGGWTVFGVQALANYGRGGAAVPLIDTGAVTP